MLLRSVERFFEIFHVAIILTFLVAVFDLIPWFFGFSCLEFVSNRFAIFWLLFAVVNLPFWHPSLLGACPITWMQNIVRRRLHLIEYKAFLHHIAADYFCTDPDIVSVPRVRFILERIIPLLAIVRYLGIAVS